MYIRKTLEINRFVYMRKSPTPGLRESRSADAKIYRVESITQQVRSSFLVIVYILLSGQELFRSRT